MTGEMSSGSSPYPTECMDRLRRAVVFRKDPFANSPGIHLFPDGHSFGFVSDHPNVVVDCFWLQCSLAVFPTVDPNDET